MPSLHLSVGDATPPEAMTLMQWAPLRSSSRAARLTCIAGETILSSEAQLQVVQFHTAYHYYNRPRRRG